MEKELSFHYNGRIIKATVVADFTQIRDAFLVRFSLPVDGVTEMIFQAVSVNEEFLSVLANDTLQQSVADELEQLFRGYHFDFVLQRVSYQNYSVN